MTARSLRPILPKAPKDGAVSSHSISSRFESERGLLEDTPPVGQLEQTPATSSSLALSASSDLNSGRIGLDSLIGSGDTSALVSSQTRRVDDYLYLFATRSPFEITEGPNSVLRKIVELQTRVPYSPFDPLKTFLHSPWFVEYVLAQSDKIMNYWYFKPRNYEKKPFRYDVILRLQTSDWSRWTTLVGIGVIDSFLTGDTSQDSMHNFWLGHIEGSLKRELTRDLVPREMQKRRNEWVHICLLKAMSINSSNVYHVLRSVTPTFLQVVFSNPTLWPSGRNVIHAPLSNILALETNQLAFFTLLDCTCAMAFGLPQQVEYDTTIYPRADGSFSQQLSHNTPAEFQLLLAEINACRDESPTARDWRDIEQSLLTWQSRPGEYIFSESWMAIAWYAVQESWRLALLVYLYLAVCNTPSDDPQIQSFVKQMLQIGICARSEAHRKAVRDKLSARDEVRLWLVPASDFVPVLDHLWHGAAAHGRPVRWSDYMHSRNAMLPVTV